MTLARELADTAGRPQGDKNLLINGGMNVWQRSTSASINSDGMGTVDRWQHGVGSLGVFTISRSTDVPSGQGFGYSMKWDCTTADASPAASDYLIHGQRIEGQNLQHLLKGSSSAKKVTLSFWVKSNKTGTYIVELGDNDNTRKISKSYTIDSASTWEKKSITYEGDTTGAFDNDNAASLFVEWWLGAGSNYTGGTLQTSWGSATTANRAVGQVNLADSTSNEFYITGCQLEVGENASGFEFEPYERTLEKCKRYYRKQVIGGRTDWGTWNHDTSTALNPEMRIAPAASQTNGNYFSSNLRISAQGNIATTPNFFKVRTYKTNGGTAEGFEAYYEYALDSELT